MIYLYTLLGINFSYPDIKNILYSSYLNGKKIKNKNIDYTDFFINEILCDENIKGIEKVKHDIKDSSKDLLIANNKFVKFVGKYLDNYGIIYNDKNGFSYKKEIRGMKDLIESNNDVDRFIDLFPISEYKDNDIIFMNVSYGFQIPMALSLTKRIKVNNSNVAVIWGGNYLTQINENCLDLLNKIEIVDSIIVFNHIKTFRDIIEYYRGKNINLCNTIFKDRKTEINKCINDNYKDYCLDYSNVDLNRYLSRDRVMPVLLNYGCYHGRCMFCAHYFHYGNYFKCNVKKIFEMIKTMYKENKFDSIILVDECVMPDILLKFAKYLIDNNINTKWIVETRISSTYLDIENVKLLAKSGCRLISFGIESYNKRILKLMDKGIDIKCIKKVLRNFYMNGVVTSATFMIGYPGENYFNIKRTLNFINHFKYIDLFGLNVFVLARNSKFCDNLNHDIGDINITYRFKNDRKEELESLIRTFNTRKKLNRVNELKLNILSRSDYLYLDRSDFSINYREV